MIVKLLFLIFTWAIALAVSFGLRFWGLNHPEPFLIRPLVVLVLLFGPSVFLGVWLVLDISLKFRAKRFSD